MGAEDLFSSPKGGTSSDDVFAAGKGEASNLTPEQLRERAYMANTPEWYDRRADEMRRQRFGESLQHARGVYDDRMAGRGSVALQAQRAGMGGAARMMNADAVRGALAQRQGMYSGADRAMGVISQTAAGRQQEIAGARAGVAGAHQASIAAEFQAQRLRQQRQAMANAMAAQRAAILRGQQAANAQAQQAMIQGGIGAAQGVIGAAGSMTPGAKEPGYAHETAHYSDTDY